MLLWKWGAGYTLSEESSAVIKKGKQRRLKTHEKKEADHLITVCAASPHAHTRTHTPLMYERRTRKCKHRAFQTSHLSLSCISLMHVVKSSVFSWELTVCTSIIAEPSDSSLSRQMLQSEGQDLSTEGHRINLRPHHLRKEYEQTNIA